MSTCSCLIILGVLCLGVSLSACPLQAEDVLLSAVGGASHVESWASVQCLSRGGVATLVIVEELLTRLHDQSQTTVRKASQLLAFLSSKTVRIDLVYNH